MTETVICWFKRDLRIHDHPALARAAALGPVIPLYIVEPDLWAQPDAAGRHYAFVCESLDRLREDLARLGLPLVVRVGEAVDVLEDLRATHGVTRLVSHQETGNGWSYARDRRVADWARGQGVAWSELPQSGVIRRLPGRDAWQGRRNGFMRAPCVPVPEGITGVANVAGTAPPEARALGLVDHC